MTAILNVCLVPDRSTPQGQEFADSAIARSQALNATSISEYRLSDTPTESCDSVPHCTLMHLRVPQTPKGYEALRNAVAPVIGRSIDVWVGDAEQVRAKAFSRDALIAGDDAYRTSTIGWIPVEPRRELLELQREVAEGVSSVLGTHALVTSQGESYQPHFTTWVRRDGSGQEPPPPEAANIPRPMVVPCKVELGDCGPIGQVRISSSEPPTAAS